MFGKERWIHMQIQPEYQILLLNQDCYCKGITKAISMATDDWP